MNERMEPIAFNDFKAQFKSIADEVEEAIKRVLESGWYVLGQEVKAFEAELAAYLGSGHCVGCASGTEAIALALMALEVGAGDEVITTALTAYPTITGIKQAGATPVAVDIDKATGLLNPREIERWITPRTRAIAPVHLYGQSCDMGAILKIAERHDLHVVEDCAQSIGASWQGQKTGTLGALGCFSFYPTKNLGAFGDGGAVTTDSAELADRLRSLRNYGQTDRYHHQLPGINSRLDELQAAILRAKLPHLDAWNQRRRELAERYLNQLSAVDPVHWRDREEAVFHLFPVLCEGRDHLMARLKAAGVSTLIHYPLPVPEQADFQGQPGAVFSAASAFAKQVLSLPLYPELSDAQVDRVCRCIEANRTG